jgi:hypothetical protein
MMVYLVYLLFKNKKQFSHSPTLTISFITIFYHEVLMFSQMQKRLKYKGEYL